MSFIKNKIFKFRAKNTKSQYRLKYLDKDIKNKNILTTVIFAFFFFSYLFSKKTHKYRAKIICTFYNLLY